MRDDVATGQSLQLAMRQQGLFPHMVIQMVAIGEESGALDSMLAKVATFYEEKVDNAVDALSSLLEPLIMVIIGGYETFVSRLNIKEHPDQPEWLSHVNAATMKIKLSMALIGISSIHLLKTFINAGQMTEATMKWQVLIHLTFIVSAIAMAYTDRIMTRTILDAHGKAEH